MGIGIIVEIRSFMIKNSIKKIALLALLFASSVSFSQTYIEFEEKYNIAKSSFENQKYQESVVLFDELSIPSNSNPFMPYAKYFKAYSYIKIQKYSEARFVLVKLQEEVPEWIKLDEVKYLLAYAQLLDKQYVEGNTSVKTIKSDDLQTKGLNMFYHFIALEANLETLKQTQSKLKKDKELAKILAMKLSNNTDSSNIALQKYLIQDYSLNPSDFGIVKSVKKDTYTVALLLPFRITNPKAYLNTPSLNIKDGIQYALDSLKSLGVKIDLKVYDTDNSDLKIKQLLLSPEFKKVDVIIGPVSGAACLEVAKFANENKIINFNFSREETLFNQGNYVYSMRPTYVNMGKELAKTSKMNFDSTLSVKIFFERNKDGMDSTIALAYKNSLTKIGVKVSHFKGVSTDLTEYKKLLESTKDTETSHIAVFASENYVMASTLVSIWEAGSKTIPVIAPKEWLDVQLINYDQFYRKNIHFIYTDYITGSSELQDQIGQKHIDQYGVKPTTYNYLTMGYDVMMLAGTQLSENGKNFGGELKKSTFIPLSLSAGLDLSHSNSNAIIPLLKFDEKYDFIWVNEPIK